MKTTRELKIIGVAICSALGLAMSGCGDDTNNPPVYDGENYLYLNTAAEGGANDQALIVDANPGSATYGKIIKSIDYGSKHNEPHHAGISHDKKSIYMMGLFPPGRVWKLDIAADPKNPTLSHLVEDAATEIGANDPDEIVTMDDGDRKSVV